MAFFDPEFFSFFEGICLLSMVLSKTISTFSVNNFLLRVYPKIYNALARFWGWVTEGRFVALRASAQKSHKRSVKIKISHISLLLSPIGCTKPFFWVKEGETKKTFTTQDNKIFFLTTNLLALGARNSSFVLNMRLMH